MMEPGTETAAPAHPINPERPFHPLADEFPLMTGAQLADLQASIRDEGQDLPITMLDGLILDGRNRWLACRGLGVEPKTEEYDGPTDFLSLARFVIRRNITRRQLGMREAERIAAAIYLRERSSHGGGGRGNRHTSSKSPIGDLVEGEEKQGDGESTMDASAKRAEKTIAAEMGVSSYAVRIRARLHRRGSDRLKACVEEGTITLGAAFELCRIGMAEQDAVIARGREAVIAKASALRGPRADGKGRGGGKGKGRRPSNATLALVQAAGGDFSAVTTKLNELKALGDQRTGHLARGLDTVVAAAANLPPEEAAALMPTIFEDFEARLLTPVLAYLGKVSAALGRAPGAAEGRHANGS